MAVLELATQALANAERVVCFSGAGISAESGIPSYRDKLTWLWARHNPQYLETAKAFRDNPKLVWGWYLWRRQQAAQAEPNAAHLASHKMVSQRRSVCIITQNIDDLHERAGYKDVRHLHSSLDAPKCFVCHRASEFAQAELVIPAGGVLVDPPRCDKCGGRMRPGMVWYGEQLPWGVWKSALSLVKNYDVLISVGALGIVTPAADFPEMALSSDATVIHVNTVDVGFGNPNELMIIGKATEDLSQLSDAVSLVRSTHHDNSC
ncbi:NAD-dependent deacylase [Pseudomonas viridiflava]|uniref:SIR2 family NAD-dependent protein deacylase n=1 Tax=Pseudomonas viridiflava TaxID=33069 RepID=UPI0018E63EF5|nr:Sir2 family NAD-dependent protein deacetylase [Pseudomonas viridiflava]MBI6578727.1 NAD-dependent deacylase [Pseudomonas viridiflava]MBI6609507.1 NAD-dependent deacylase [Pseudomonas viridiflava]MBI6640292.1 NAD-dependent deacylase [Pseudomonas viridiflava]MBI6871018.1 NAD-dependent deacylase [Pseudomonas viridiflava]